MALPKKIPGAQKEIRVLDNMTRLALQSQILKALDNDDSLAMEIQQIDHHLEMAFGFADIVLDRLEQAGLKDIAKRWQSTFTGNILSYPILSASPE